MDKKEKVFETIERLAPLIPTAFYWTDTDGVIMGFNQSCLLATGAPVPITANHIGKEPWDIYPAETAKIVCENTKKVVTEEKAFDSEEFVTDPTTGKKRYYKMTLAPICDGGMVFGTVGSTLEITAEKEAPKQKIKLEKMKNFFRDLKEEVVEVENSIKSSLEESKALCSNAAALVEDLPITEDQRKQIASLFESVNHNYSEVGKLINVFHHEAFDKADNVSR